ncbi:MAG: hypothetical protein A2V65_06160 [Deltaproteobacteria bacterium RBG_13_49_15]|nr:MAG: hypothetical protein A2V65_06160 [Deltaproteobacteria bacterium RBG_13_49_15]
MMKRRTKLPITFLTLIPLWIGLFPSIGVSKTVALPLTLDYKLLRSLVIQTSFTGPGQSATVLDQEDGCNFIRISDPTFSEKKSFLWCETRVQIRTGVPFNENCLMTSELNGYVAFHIQPIINRRTLKLTFRTIDSVIYDQNHKPKKVAGVIWDAIKEQVYDYINHITIDLEPSMTELKSFLEPLFPAGPSDKAKAMLDSLRLGEVKIAPDAVRIEILTEVEEMYEPEKEKKMEVLSDKDVETIIESWETWDAFLVQLILSLVNRPLSENDRQILLDTLLATRYRFTTELNELTLNKDLVREQFIEAWTELSPVFRNHLSSEASEFTLGYLAFFTASDALSTLDRIGPTLGIEISRNGLIRLARLISRGKPTILDYDLSLNRDLREILDLGSPLSVDYPPEETEEYGLKPEKEIPWRIDPDDSFLFASLFTDSPIYAIAKKKDSGKLIPEKWIVPENDIDPYIERIEKLLEDSSAASLKKTPLQAVYHDFYRRLIPAIAWQESCFRQFQIENGEITFLLSYNRTSVGIMQINERVWRGIYDLDQLKWNIHYNTLAGCEIADQYLRRYALEKLKKMNPKVRLTEELVAGVVYAMYNGGPQQFDRYLARKKKNRHYLSDTLFMEKFRWVNHGKLEHVKLCLQ